MGLTEQLGQVGEYIREHALTTLWTEHNVRSEHANLHLRTETMKPGDKLKIAGQEFAAPIAAEALHVFADLSPLQNWGHASRHFFYHSENGALMHSQLYDEFPPHEFDSESGVFEPLHLPVVHQERPPRAAKPATDHRFYLGSAFKPMVGAAPGKRYAILFSGNSNNRHVNDLEFLYRVLTQVYQFDAENIIVLNFDGTLQYEGRPQPVGNWPGDNTPYELDGHIDGPGTKIAFEEALLSVARKLQPQDLLLIHTNNHGSSGVFRYGEPWLCGWPDYSLVFTTSDWGPILRAFPPFRSLIVSMEQCFSGSFMIPTIANSTASETSFAASVPWLPSMAGINFDPWALDWIAALNGAYPNGLPLKRSIRGGASTLAAFEYSRAVHVLGDWPVFGYSPLYTGTKQVV